MSAILGGLTVINNVDIWKVYGAFLVEDKRGDMENLTAILTPSKAKQDTPVSLREEHGERYAAVLVPRNEARDVTLHFALYATTKAAWFRSYLSFINFLKQGNSGWLDIAFPQLDITLRVKYMDCSKFKSITYLWKEGVHAGKFRVKFREPNPII